MEQGTVAATPSVTTKEEQSIVLKTMECIRLGALYGITLQVDSGVLFANYKHQTGNVDRNIRAGSNVVLFRTTSILDMYNFILGVSVSNTLMR